MMARNHSRRATDGRRSKWRRHSQHYRQPLLHTNGHAVLHEVPRLSPSKPRAPLALIPGVLAVGAYSPLMGDFAVTFMGEAQRMKRDTVNRWLQLNSALRLAMEAQKLPPKPAPPVMLLLPAWCATAKPVPTQEVDAIAAAA